VDRCGRLRSLWPAGLLALALLMGSPVPSEAAPGQGQKPQKPDNAMDAGLIKAIDQVMALVALEHQMGGRVPGLDSGLRDLMQALLSNDEHGRHHHHHHHHHAHHHHHHRFADGLRQAGGNNLGQLDGNVQQQSTAVKGDKATGTTSSKSKHKGACACVGQMVGKKFGKERTNLAQQGNPNQAGASQVTGGKTGGNLTAHTPSAVNRPGSNKHLRTNATMGTNKSVGQTGTGNNGQRLTTSQGSSNKMGSTLHAGVSSNKGKTGMGTALVSAGGNKGSGKAASAGHAGGRCSFKSGISQAAKSHGSGSKKR